MKVLCYLTVFLVLTLSARVHGKPFTMRSMSAREVYRTLREAGREDAIPEGRIITQGIAAVSGFGLGLLKGIGGSTLVNLATSNQSLQLLSNLNFTALSSLFSSSSNGTTYTTQEICFSSRSLNQIDNDDAVSDQPQGRQGATSPTVTTSPSTTATSTTSPTTSVTSSPVTTGTTTPTTTATTGGTTTTDSVGTGSGTNTDTTTETDGASTVNCVVIQKPITGKKGRAILRKRRDHSY